MDSIEAEMTVNEIVLRYPLVLAVLGRAGIDTCCGGELPLGEAARRHGIDAAALLEELRALVAAAGRTQD